MQAQVKTERSERPLVSDIREPADEAAVGGKGRRLYELTAMGASVPNGFTVTAAAFSDFVQTTRLDAAIGDKLTRLDVGDEAAIRAGSAGIVAMIADADLPSDLAQIICDAYDALCFQSGTLRLKVAVRSSAIGEDAKDASFAGQFETFLGVAGHEALIAHVKKVWASLFNERAILYRLKNGLPHDAPMAVVVLELADARSAGVAFSVDPLTGKRDRITIEGNWGFGESVVQGVVTPDRAAVDKADLRILDYVVADKTTVSVFDPDTRLVVEEPAPARFRKARVLGDAEVDAIARAVRSVEEKMGEPVDVEWVIPRHWRPSEPPVLVQVRPVTTLEAEAPAPAWNNLDYAAKYGFGVAR